MTTAEKLVRLRKEKGLSQLQLAEEINVSRQAISRWEVGLAVPSREKLRALSELYNVSMDYLLSDKEAEDVQKVSEPEDEAKEKSSNHLRVGLIACVVVILLIGAMLLHLHNTHEPQNEVPISEMETEEDDVVFSGDFSVDW
jgi:transcriptional regulator with XRE-family HTH domain